MESTVLISGLQTQEQKVQLATRLQNMIGVESVEIDMDAQKVKLRYQTPANLNTLEKEIYDAGYAVINSYKGEN
ncbi:hypothetical protein TP70_02865 [Staphylococcus microti]|uniref:HMA domain-containing protein n=1 Tax=Staphylococcus microti TaxID=569857 RepID=A0A0D6XS07_9STAP|nr:heavy metal-associated domain-containing protein [Staphylococcus microti]KIX91372.1 hypothetical protein TP70_02865 [Staphylococcus microti]PNZ75960.1 hypothetical protein CD132_11710 [Staphylococcus microti]SUM58029.1 Uncharacterised protein [Staphylococcus microti]